MPFDRTDDNRAGAAIEGGGDQRANGQDRIGGAKNDCDRRGPKADRLGQHRGRGRRATRQRHRQHSASDAHAKLRVIGIADAAGLGVDAAPEAQRRGEDERLALGLAARIGLGGADHGATLTSLPAGAEATQSASSPKATVAPMLAGA